MTAEPPTPGRRPLTRDIERAARRLAKTHRGDRAAVERSLLIEFPGYDMALEVSLRTVCDYRQALARRRAAAASAAAGSTKETTIDTDAVAAAAGDAGGYL